MRRQFFILLLFSVAGLVWSDTPQAIEFAQSPPTVILISIDGFRNDYLQKFPLPNLNTLATNGVHAPLVSVFPSVTFPNHYSIATGLYPEHHGIVLNEFLAADFTNIADTSSISWQNGLFTHNGHAPTVYNAHWDKGEPIWVTAEKQGQFSASAFWPSSAFTINNIKPTYLRAFSEDSDPLIRSKQILQWLDLPSSKRPRLLLLYFENVDNAGHLAGPDSIAVRNAAIKVDAAIGVLLKGLEQRGLTSSVNVIVVSDHGMSKVHAQKVIDLMKFIAPKDLVTITDEGAIVGVYPKVLRIKAVYNTLKHAAVPMQVYLASELPASLHYRTTYMPPIICVAREHAFILGRDRKVQRGTHGYNPLLKSMHGIFIAFGPAFKRDYVRNSFKNIHIYSLVSEILGLKAASNDGSLTEILDILSPHHPIR